MSRIRDPARDKAKELYLSNKDITNREIANILGVDEKKIATWKYRDNWDCSTSKKKNVVQQKRKSSTTNKKKLINKAKAIVVQGGTIEEAADKTGLNKSTLLNYSASEKWIEQQEKFLKKVYNQTQEELGEKFIRERIETVKILGTLKSKTFTDVMKGQVEVLKHYGTAIKNIVDATEAQSKLLGIPDMKMYIRKDTDDNENIKEEKTLRIEVID
jgi:phage terminase small subunit|nr:MAG TPA: terminase small subunit [Caudoviricetes sp.]